MGIETKLLAVLSSGAVYYDAQLVVVTFLFSVQDRNRTSAHKQMQIHSGLSYKIYLLKLTSFHCYTIFKHSMILMQQNDALLCNFFRANESLELSFPLENY